jgi:membrane protein DedA with SNARE-associated domain
MAEPEQIPGPTRDEVPAAVIGTALWAILFVVLAVFFRHDLQRHDAGWWLWTCLIGLLMGFYGIWYALRRRSHTH